MVKVVSLAALTAALVFPTGTLAQEASGNQTNGQAASQTDGQSAVGPTANETTAAASANETSTTTDADIVVTATRRAERVRDIAGSISALSGQQLQALGAQDYADYLTRLPGVAFSNGPSGVSTAVIRGIGTTAGLDQGQGTTGYFINDIPLTEPGYATGIPDIDTFDVNRVEVQRGPAGTLFGSAALGGAINFIANVADPSGLHAAAEGMVGSTHNADGQLNYSAKVMLNVPIIPDKLAARFVYVRRQSAGYLDNIGIGKKGSNDLKVEDWRGSLVFTPSDATKITYLGLYQKNDTDDVNFRFADLGKYIRNTAIEVPFRFGTELHNLRLDQDMGFATLTASAAYVHKTDHQFDDYTPFYGSLAGDLPQTYKAVLGSKTQDYEVRLASPKSGTFDWLVGAMHEHISKTYTDYIYGPNAESLIQQGQADAGLDPYDESLFFSYAGQDAYYSGVSKTSGNESAVFGEANLHFAQHLTLTGGGRLFHTDSDTLTNYYGIFYGVGGLLGDKFKVKDSGFAPKVSLSYRDNGVLVYALASKGFRFGSANTIFPLAGFDTPAGTTSDSLWNYEAGTKLDLFDRKVQLDLTGFFVDWKNLQLRLTRPDGDTYGANAGAAHIYGAETSITVHPVRALTLASNITYLDAKISEGVASAGIEKGQRLPSSAKWRISNSVSYQFPGELQPTLTLLHRYVSSETGYINQPYIFDGYNVFDIRAGVHKGPYAIAAFVENVGNKDAVTFGYGDYGVGLTEYIIRPRTFGVQLDWAM